jgi:hypothetical protein
LKPKRRLIIYATDKSKWILNNQKIRAILDRYWEATVAHNLERVHEFYHDDVVVEFPQSGERIRGKHNIYELRAHYPAKVTFKILRVRGAAGWLRWIKTVFERGKINEIWKNIELEKWFDPAFQEFVDRELSHAIRK